MRISLSLWVEGSAASKKMCIRDRICADFASIPVQGEPKIRVGVVGEIYVKFAPLGNNNLEQFLLLSLIHISSP